MLKLTLDHWRLVDLKDKYPEDFELLRKADPSIPPKEELKDKYMSYSFYIQDASELPQSVLDRANWEAIKPLKVLFEGNSAKGVKEALAAYQVHLPGNELLGIQSVQVQEDLCTDELQHFLDKGWRIIAALPRSNARRPDYVLGRFCRT